MEEGRERKVLLISLAIEPSLLNGPFCFASSSLNLSRANRKGVLDVCKCEPEKQSNKERKSEIQERKERGREREK